MSASCGGINPPDKKTSRFYERLFIDYLASSSRNHGVILPELAPAVDQRLPRYQRAGPSTSLDEKM
jgi:hypothetical protein